MSLITRKDVPVEETWNLADIFPTDEAWEQSYILVEQELDEILQSTISLDSANSTLAILEKYDRIMESFNQTSSYAFYKYSEDESDPDNQSMLGRSQILAKKSHTFSTNLVNTFLQLPKETIQKFKSEEKGLHTFQRFLEKNR